MVDGCRCYDGRWSGFVVLDLIAILLYPIGIPVFFLVMLLR